MPHSGKRYYVTQKVQRIYLGNNNQNFQIVWLNNWGEKLKFISLSKLTKFNDEIGIII